MTSWVKKLGTAAIATAAVLSFAGCGGDSAGEGGTDADGNVTIHFMWWGSDARAKKQQEVIAKFEEKNPGIKVQTETASYNDYITKLSTYSVANTLPDVMTLIDPFMYDYTDNGQILDLKTLKDVDLSTMPEDSYKSATGENGEVYGASLGNSGHGILLNKKVFEKYGVEVPDTDNWSWDDFEKVAKEISDKSNGEAVGFSDDMYGHPLTAMLRQHGQSLNQSEDGSKPLNLTDDSVIADYFTFAKRMSDEGASLDPAKAQELAAAGGSPQQSLIAQDKAAMAVISMNQLGQFESTAGHELTPVMWPGEAQSDKKGGWIKSGTYVSISANTEHPEAAAKLVNFLVNDEDAIKIMGLDRGVPANTELASKITDSLSDSDKRMVAWTEKMTKLMNQPVTRKDSRVAAVDTTDLWNNALQSVLFGRATPQDAAKSYYETLAKSVA